MHEDGLDLVPVIVGEDTYRMAYDVVANSTLWYCHHHMWDLPLRPRFDRHWRQAWEGYRAYNRAMADAVVARAEQGASGAGAGLPLLAAGPDAGRTAPRPAHRPLLAHPLRAPAILAVLPDDVRAELLEGMAGYGACGFHCHEWEAGFRACYETAGLRRAGHLRRAARARGRRHRGGARPNRTAPPHSSRCGPRWAAGA